MKKIIIAVSLIATMFVPGVVMALDRPYVGVTFFYWYGWDYKKEWGSWVDGGVHNTPLFGYYNSPSYEDNYHSLWLASEWGITHHYMDYWGPGWKAKDNKTPRETIVIQAAEQLQKEGYDINMSFLQDGFKFNMEDFSMNISDPKNPDVRFWLDNYARSPVWLKWQGKPLWMVYANSGSPKMTAENTGYRKHLEKKYGTIDKLNKQWDAKYSSFNEISFDLSRGWPRVESILYQYSLWQASMDEMNRLVKEKYGWEGITPEFDIWCEPYKGFGYSIYHKVLNAPTSYGGVFDRPESQDPQRFIQSAVSKAYNTAFHDNYKNYYADWNTENRIPGMCYFPDPFHYDRFWVGDLMRFAEATYHLSWNEWWEGSNLEPCLEYGKLFCEKTLFYNTVIKECFDSIHNYAKGAKTAVLLNDWSWLYGGNDPADVYGIIQTLRALSVPFRLVPDDFVTSKGLESFDLVIAPSNKTGFGFNAQNESVSKALQAWVEGKQGRKLIVSSCQEFIAYLGLKEGNPKKTSAEKGKDLNIFLNIGEEGDDIFPVEGWSGREDWGKLPAGSFGATSGRLTVRWTPSDGDRWQVTCPVSSNRDHIVRWKGNAIWSNSVTLVVEGKKAGEPIEILPGWHEYEASIPANIIGSNAIAAIAFVYSKKKVPGEVNPEVYKGEARVCNMSLDWVQISTSNIEKGNEAKMYEIPKAGIALSDETIFKDIKGREIEMPFVPHKYYDEKSGKAVSRYIFDQAPKDIVINKGKGEVLFSNGFIGTLEDKPYWEKLLSNWARIDMPKTVYGDNVRGARLFSGGTNILLAYNYDQLQIANCKLSLGIPLGQIVNFKDPVAEVVVLRSDGSEYKPMAYEVKDGKVTFQDDIRYFGVYEVVFSPLAISNQPLVLHPGEKASVELALKNISDSAISGTLKLKATIPTLGSDVINYSLGPKEEKKMSLNIWAKDTVDWGHKTVMLEATWLTNEPSRREVGTQEAKGSTPKEGVGASAPSSSGRAVYWRPLFVERNPDLVVQTRVIDCQNPVLSIKNQEFKPMTSKEKGFSTNAVAKDVKVTMDGKTTSFGDIASNQSISKSLNLQSPEPSSASVEQKVLQISFTQDSRQVTIRDTVSLMLYPKPKSTDKETKFFVSNSTDKEMTDRLFKTDLPKGLVTPFMLVNEKGESIPAQIVDQTLMFVSSSVPANACVEYTIRKGVKGNDNADMALQAQGLGTGKGTFAITNRHYSITLSEEKGGTATSFSNLSRSFDYANCSFGVNYGQFSKHDPLVPTQNAVQFIKESKTRQSDSPGRIKVLVDGPVYKKAQVTWSDANIDATQVYEFFGSQRQFRITTDIKPKGQALNCEEVVAFDANLMRNKIFKIYPGGSGMKGFTGDFKKEFPHGGWRYSDYLYPYSTLVSNKDYISFLVEEKTGLNKYRQGIWPEKRPETGKLDYAEIEYISLFKGADRQDLHISVWVMMHGISHKQAKDFQSDWSSPLGITSNIK